MKLRFAILSGLLIFSLALTAWAHVAVLGRREDVPLEETVLVGDPAAVAGLTVDLRTKSLDQLFWETTYTAGPESTASTAYTYTRDKQAEPWVWEPQGVDFSFWGDCGPTREDEIEDERGMERPFNDVLSRCPAGTEGYTERVDLSDYYEEFPIYAGSVDIFPDGVGVEYPPGWNTDSIHRHVQEELRRCFPIAVPQGSWAEIVMDKRADGTAGASGYSPPENVAQPEVRSVVTERGCYFILSSPWREDGVRLDASRFPLGYGVYFLPVSYGRERGETYGGEAYVRLKLVGVGSITQVHPIDPGVDYVDLYPSADGSRLYLLTQRDGGMTLTVLDAADGRELDTLPLSGEPEAGTGDPDARTIHHESRGNATVVYETVPRLDNLIIEEDFLVPYWEGGGFSVVTWEGEDYETALTGSFAPLYDRDLRLSWDARYREEQPAADFDGERLAVAYIRFTGVSDGFWVAVYGGEGLEFLARCDSRRGSGAVEPLRNTPLTVTLPGGG